MMELTVIKRDFDFEVVDVRFVQITSEELKAHWEDDEWAMEKAGFQEEEGFEVVADWFAFCEEY